MLGIVFFLGANTQRNRTFNWRSGASVLQQMDKNLLQSFAIGLKWMKVIRDINAQRDVLFTQLAGCISHGIIDEQVQVNGFGLKRHQASFQRCDLDQITNQTPNALCGGADTFDKFAL